MRSILRKILQKGIVCLLLMAHDARAVDFAGDPAVIRFPKFSVYFICDENFSKSLDGILSTSALQKKSIEKSEKASTCWQIVYKNKTFEMRGNDLVDSAGMVYGLPESTLKSLSQISTSVSAEFEQFDRIHFSFSFQENNSSEGLVPGGRGVFITQFGVSPLIEIDDRMALNKYVRQIINTKKTGTVESLKRWRFEENFLFIEGVKYVMFRDDLINLSNGEIFHDKNNLLHRFSQIIADCESSKIKYGFVKSVRKIEKFILKN